MSDNNITTYALNIAYEGATPAEIDELTRHLQQELLNSTDVYDATLPANQTPLESGAKSAAAITWGQVMLDVLPTALPAVIVAIQAWLLRQQNQKIEIKIGDNQITIPRGTTPEEVQAYVDMLRSDN